MSAPADTWAEDNLRYLRGALAQVRAAVTRHEGGAAPPAPEWIQQAGSQPPALEVLCAAFGLSAFERALLIACAGVELDPTFRAEMAAAQGDPRAVLPSFGLLLASVPGAHWSALSPTAPLRRFRLLEVGAGDGMTRAPLRLDERVLHFLVGVNSVDERLLGLLEPLAPRAEELAPSQQATAARLAALLQRREHGQPAPVMQLCGRDAASLRAAAACATFELGLGLYALSAADVPPSAHEREALQRLWEREALLAGVALLLELDDAPPDAIRAAAAFAERAHSLVLLAGREPIALRSRPTLRFDLGKPTPPEQEALFRAALGSTAAQLNGQLDRVLANFDLGAPAIRAASVLAGSAPGDPGAALWSACCAQSRPRLADLAQRLLPSAAAWEDLILPEQERATLRELVSQVRQRRKVYEQWGFGAKSLSGRGVSALFAGPSGTGKTMAAEILSSVLELDLYRIDLSQVVSKFIGETEKNLRRVFDAADDGGAILLFDEADALFGKRSEVKDSHDRYANIEVGYLLQRMETYRGLAILTTNMRDALDPAFLRRLRFVVQFPFPAEPQRAEIWRRIFPPGAPTEGLDAQKLARLHVAGGSIRNIALNAAFLAADEGQPVRMRHLLRAAQSEARKHERTLAEAEVKEWA